MMKMTDPIRTLLKRVLQLHTMAGGPWTAEVKPESHYYDIPISGPSGRYIARSPDDGVRAGFEIHDAQLIAEYRTIAPAMARALEAVLEVHRAVEIEPSGTICHECSTLRGTGVNARYFPYEEWPCLTVCAITSNLGGET